MSTNPTPNRRFLKKAEHPRGLERDLRLKPEARPWLHEQLNTTKPGRIILADLAAIYGIHTSKSALSDYLRRHKTEIVGLASTDDPVAPVATVAHAGFSIAVFAPGAERIEITINPTGK